MLPKKNNPLVSENWQETAYNAVLHVARRHQYFTTDTVWNVLERFPKDGRNLGLAIRNLAENCLITPTDRYKPSERLENRGRMVRVWQSLCQAKEAWNVIR